MSDRDRYDELLTRIRNEIIEECAKVCENLRHVDYPSETSEWSSGTFDCAQAIRDLIKKESAQ